MLAVLDVEEAATVLLLFVGVNNSIFLEERLRSFGDRKQRRATSSDQQTKKFGEQGI
jgi:hypothetical protein